ncbi:MAG: hypothetical protein DRG25_05415 [Deltaproteobacteria bacterium]|nr:MAG: hypothetical protein DRG25_05415 [Deltaproteobacteria bacterium]
MKEKEPFLYKLFWTGLLFLLFFLPLAFSTSFYRSFETIKSSLLRISIILLLLTWIVLPKARDFSSFPSTPIIRAILLFLLSSFISSLLSIAPTLSIFGIYERQVGLIGVLAVTLFFLLLIEGLKIEGNKNSVVKIMALSGTIVSLYSLLQYFDLDPIAWPKAFGDRPFSTLGHPDFLGDLLALVIPLSLALCYLEKGWRIRSVWIFSILIQLGGLLVSQTRGAWIAVTVSIATFFLLEPFLYRKKGVFQKRIIISLVSLFFFFSLAGLFLLVKPEFRFRAASILKIKEQTRIYLWRDSFKVIKKYPIFGSGPETFRLSFMPYKGIELAKMEKNVNYDNPHNNYLYIWATTGTLGLITYLYLLFCSFREGIRNLKENIASNPTLYLGILTSLEAYCIAMLTGFDTITTIFYFYGIIVLIAVSDNHLVKKDQITKPKHKGNFLVMIVIILSGLIIYDTSRVLLADHLTLKALKLVGKKPPHLLKARQILKRSCNLLPRESFYRLQLAMVNLKIGRKEVGKKDSFREAVHWGYLSLLHSWAPENSYNVISTAYLNLRDCRSAEWACRRGLEVDPYNYPLRTNLAISLSCQGKRKEALNEVIKALSIDPSYSLAIKLKKFLTGRSELPELHHQP